MNTTLTAPAGTAGVSTAYGDVEANFGQVSVDSRAVPQLLGAGFGFPAGPANPVALNSNTYQQAAATQLGYGFNVLVPGVANASFILPPALAGSVVVVAVVTGSNYVASIYPAIGDDGINENSNNEPFDFQNPNLGIGIFTCVEDGAWDCGGGSGAD